uniref:Uncharacterized protein n=1 Tax=Magnaporthe oryzae polymycovirus 1 TaxID=2509266 RepID=A0A8E6Z6Y2_9VIRU|nr:hypothetical protein [Magnaporthe oryzae polymycovirus 1]
MSLNDSVSAATAKSLTQHSPEVFNTFARLVTLGFSPPELRAALVRVANGEEVPLPGNLGRPRPLTINAWSFCVDRGQYADTYGLDDAEAGRLKGVLRTNADDGVAEITKLVTDKLRVSGSSRAVHVTKSGMPQSVVTGSGLKPGKQGGADLKTVILTNPALFGMYTFAPTDSGVPGPLRYRCRIGSGLYACFPSKRGAIDVARICRVHGRDHEAIAGRVYFIREGKAPLTGADIPEKVKFDGKLRPDEPVPADPVNSPRTEVS